MARKITIDVVGGYPALKKTEGVFEIPALEVTEVLAVNEDLALDDRGDIRYGGGWNVTHVPTGWALVRGLPTQGTAKAAAELLAVLDFDAITTADPTKLAKEAAAKDLGRVKTFIADQVARSKTSKAAEEKLRKEKRRTQRGKAAAPARAAKRRPPGAAPSKKGKKKAPRPSELDLLALARRARTERNPTKDRLLSW